MKRFLILGFVLVLVLSLGLVACGGGDDTTTTAAPASTDTTAAPAGTDTTAAPAETTTTAAAAAQEPVTFKLASTFIESESGGRIVQHFADYINSKATNVKIEVYPGGTLGGSMELLGLITSGAVDIVPLGHPPYADKLPLLNFPMFAPGSPQAAVDYFNELTFKNADTAPLIQGEAEALGIKYLGFTAGGSNVFVSKSAFTKLSDLVGKKFGAGGSIPAFEALGYTVIQAFPPDIYEDLSRGVIDATQMGFVPSVNLKWYEVAKYYMLDGTYAAGNPWTVNLKSWAKLTPENQQIFMDAAKDAETFSLDMDKTDTEAMTKTITDAGVTLGTLSADDVKAWYQLLFAASAKDCTDRAAKLGITDQENKVLAAAAKFTGVAWPAQ